MLPKYNALQNVNPKTIRNRLVDRVLTPRLRLQKAILKRIVKANRTGRYLFCVQGNIKDSRYTNGSLLIVSSEPCIVDVQAFGHQVF